MLTFDELKYRMKKQRNINDRGNYNVSEKQNILCRPYPKSPWEYMVFFSYFKMTVTSLRMPEESNYNGHLGLKNMSH